MGLAPPSGSHEAIVQYNILLDGESKLFPRMHSRESWENDHWNTKNCRQCFLGKRQPAVLLPRGDRVQRLQMQRLEVGGKLMHSGFHETCDGQAVRENFASFSRIGGSTYRCGMDPLPTR